MKTQEQVFDYIVRECLSGKPEGLTTDTSLFDLGILNSMEMVRLVRFLESTFSIKVEDHEYVPDYFLSIERIVMFVEGKCKKS